MGMFNEDNDLARRAVELQQQAEALEQQLAALPADASAAPEAPGSIEYDAKAIPKANPGGDVDASDVFGSRPRTQGLEKSDEKAMSFAWLQDSLPQTTRAGSDEDDSASDDDAKAIPDVNPGVRVDEDDLFGGETGSAPATSGAGGLPRGLIGVPIAVVLVIAALVSRMAQSPQTDAAATAAGALPQTTSAAATVAPVSFGGGTYGPLKVTRGQGSSISLYQLPATGPLPGSSVKWTIDAPCGELAPLTASAQVSWSFDNNTKTCPPAGGPYPGTVKVTFTASDGKTYTWSAGSETGSYGETVTVR